MAVDHQNQPTSQVTQSQFMKLSHIKPLGMSRASLQLIFQKYSVSQKHINLYQFCDLVPALYKSIKSEIKGQNEVDFLDTLMELLSEQSLNTNKK